MSSAPSSQISPKADPLAPADPVIEIGFASHTDDDGEAIELHRFLCVVSAPVLYATIDARDSISGVIEVLREGFAVTARANGELVGSLGIFRGAFWYNRGAEFMTDRWFFTYPPFRAGGDLAHLAIGARMIAEADAIATRANLPLFINGHQRRRGRGVLTFTRPRILGTAGNQETH